ncbi:Peroxisomal biogenesis factor 19 [Oopsacas minuta]|uniref:Peroxin-19 n=1 Tax=Oopsacas minuta TaxID=111878 RepID=A0AAV7JX29_9METZ|nr:Peroxisomal biogenesis factor 19 [Oopsacas minuta]
MAERNDRNDNMPGLIEDTELDGLLDDALLDYDIPSKPIQKAEQLQSVPQAPHGANTLLTDVLDPAGMEEMTSMMQGIFGKDLVKEYELFSKELEHRIPDMFNTEGDTIAPGSSQHIPSDKHRSNISTEDTIKDLNKNLEDAKSAVPQGLEEGGEHMLGMVKDLMGDLLSQEVLYEPMKELCEQFPKYLDEEELGSEDRQRYSRQFVVMQEVCREYETESKQDSQHSKQDRQNRILGLVQELQELGNPPPGLVNAPALPDLSQIPQNDNLCNQQLSILTGNNYCLKMTCLHSKLFDIFYKMTEVKEEKLENIPIKTEINNSEQTDTNEQTKIKQEMLEQTKIKQEIIKNEIQQESVIEGTQSAINSTEYLSPVRTVSPQRKTPKVRPQRPKRNAISLEKVNSIDTQDLFTYNPKATKISPKMVRQSVKEMIEIQPEIETECHRYPGMVNTCRSRKRQYIDNLFDKYDNGVRIFNEDGSLETEIENPNNETPISPQDPDLEMLILPPKKIRTRKTLERIAKSEINKITQKYNFIENIVEAAEPSYDDINLNRSTSNEFSVRIKCKRHVYSFHMLQDAAFTETIENLAKKLEILPKQIMLMHRDETVLHTDTPALLNLDENTILEAIILSSFTKSPIKPTNMQIEQKIKIKIQFAKNFGGLVPIMAPLSADLNGILVQVCESKDLTHTDFQLQFDGEQMDLNNNLQDYDLEDGDVIDAILVT